jgi:Resolvase, N terminal domain
LRRALDQLDKSDVLMVTRLDRLARSTRDLLNTFSVATAITQSGSKPIKKTDSRRAGY